jgi:hypothetical protein
MRKCCCCRRHIRMELLMLLLAELPNNLRIAWPKSTVIGIWNVTNAILESQCSLCSRRIVHHILPSRSQRNYLWNKYVIPPDSSQWLPSISECCRVSPILSGRCRFLSTFPGSESLSSVAVFLFRRHRLGHVISNKGTCLRSDDDDDGAASHDAPWSFMWNFRDSRSSLLNRWAAWAMAQYIYRVSKNYPSPGDQVH